MSQEIAKLVKSPLRVPPHDSEAEQAFLGSIMLKPYSLNDVGDSIKPDDFYSEKHRIIYKSMISLFEKNEPIDLVSVTSKLKESKNLDRVGGSCLLYTSDAA